MLGDIRYALRGFFRSPGFALVAMLSLTLGIGANTAIFSLVNAVLLRTLPVPEPNRLVLFTAKSPDGFAGNSISHLLFTQMRDRNSVLSGFAGVSSPAMTVSAGGVTERLPGELVSGNYFETLGVHALLGRVFTPEDDRVPDGHPVCVISYGLWQRRFGGDPSVVGRTIQINRRNFTVLGVTPKEFLGVSMGSSVDVRVPLMMQAAFMPFRALNNTNFIWIQGIGRLRPGVSVAQAQASLDVLYRQLTAEQSPEHQADDARVILQPGAQGNAGLRRQFEQPLWLLLSVVGLVLLIACANVANLLMSRASGRRREIAVRLALGAGRTRLIRQLLAESLILAAGAAALGMLLAIWVDRMLVAMAPRRGGGIPLVLDVTPDWRVFAFTLGVSILVGVLFGLAPAIQFTRPELAPALKGESGGRGPGRVSFRNGLVVAQIALSLTLLIGAGLFLRSLRNLKSVDAGFDPQGLVLMSVNPSLSGYNQEASWNFFDALLTRARSMPGVVSVSLAKISPLSGGAMIASVNVPGYQPRGAKDSAVWVNYVGADYFRTMGTRLRMGRVFSEQDGRGANKVLIVNETAAAHFWPQESPIGKKINLGDGDAEIVGLIQNAKYQDLKDDSPATAYAPLRQGRAQEFTLHARVAGPAAPVMAALTQEIRSMDRNVPIYNVTTMDAQLDNNIALDRLMASLTAFFGVLAVVLAAVGLYGVMAYAVAARTREIGIRMALGANRVRVLRQVIGESAVLTAIGVAIGIPAALWASRAVGSLLYGLKPTDPATYAALAVVLAAVALGAAWIPAHRASKVDPMVALRYE